MPRDFTFQSRRSKMEQLILLGQMVKPILFTVMLLLSIFGLYIMTKINK